MNLIQVEVILCQDGLKIFVKNSSSNSILSGVIQSIQCSQNLMQYFQNLEELMNYIKIKDNYIIDSENNLFKIIFRMNTRKLKQIELANIPLVPAKISLQYKLKQIIQKCNSEYFDSKLLIKSLAIILTDFINEGKQNNTIHNKYQNTLKQQLNVLKRKIKDQNQNELFEFRKQVQQGFTSVSQWLAKLKQQMQSNISSIVQKINQIQKERKAASNLGQKGIADEKFLNYLIDEKMKKAGILKLTDQNITQSVDKSIINNINQLNQRTKNIKQLVNREQLKAVGEKLAFLSQKFQTLQNKLQIIQKPASLNILKPLPVLVPKKSQQWIDPGCLHYQTLTLNNNSILASDYCYIFGKPNKQRIYSYSVTIDKMNDWIYLGVIDSSYKFKEDLTGVPHRILYSTSGDVREGKQVRKKQGRGLRQGQTITIIINHIAGKIQWKVGHQLKYSHQCHQLRDSKIQWVPFISLHSQDKISLSEQKV